ncbi:V-type ATP synthase subunit I [Streptococcus moroccensis]|uniref:V/A-type H+-transporting ATPase subunit I n=1 Tax=Streptococcus moroccensis TaxID=1451356 RepID=A0ABT9YW55_9STRE|nr:V-type ATP synthase subunit I [Streptococcus moroccensis]MDQ0223295.1 V/A-type H+-transporting ATPase subunit I [Streptococcus moroccensis]
MAISQMQKLSLILPKEQLDDVLLSMQTLRHVEVRDLSQDELWQEALEQNHVHMTPVTPYDKADATHLEGEEALAYFMKRQYKLEAAIQQLKSFLPQQSFWESMRQKKREDTFDAVESQGRMSLEENLLKQVRALFREHGQLKEQIEKIALSQENLAKWKGLETTPKELSQFKHIRALVGTIPNTEDNGYLNALKETEGLDFQEVFRTDTEYGVILFLHPQGEHGRINLDDFLFKPFDYPYEEPPHLHLEELASAKSDFEARTSEIESQLRDAQGQMEQLENELEMVTNRYAREEAKKQLASSQYLVAIEGWIESSELSHFKQQLFKKHGETVYIKETDINMSEDDLTEVPIKLVNHPLVEPFELITEMYSLPKYNEKDPTPYLAPFYFTFFGMMVADLGYGLLMFILTGLALKLFEFEPGMKRFLKFFNALGVSVSIWGLIYGSFFAYELAIQLISTTDDVMTILILSVAFGFVTVLTGLYLGGRQKMRIKDYAEAYNSGFAWCLILIGILLFALGKMIPAMAVFAPIGQWLAILNAIGILVVSIIQAKGLGGLGSGLFNLYNISSYVGDLVSFTRLMALGLSGASIGLAFNLIVGLLPGISRWTIGILLFILLHAINIFLSLLSAYVHGARLMFVEFFGKFYEGGGRAFNPLKPAEKYFTIKKVHLEDK